jgi:hypothetical protein
MDGEGDSHSGEYRIASLRGVQYLIKNGQYSSA